MDDEEYSQNIEKLKEAFEAGTVKFRNDNKRAYIPNQVYTDRLERVLEGRWSKEIREIEVNIPHSYVKAVVRVYIGSYFRDGSAIAEITSQGVINAEERAKNAAYIEALDSWEMGWRDLAQYNDDWGKNPALAHLLSSSPSPGGVQIPPPPREKVDRRCIGPNCGKFLTNEDYNVLKMIPNFNIQKMVYCPGCLPDAFMRKLEPVASSLPAHYKTRLSEALEKAKKK
ncbi:hypothetical protein [Paenibacillus sp. GYB003]|uniref:hypothetical protein n=1 Tax=Paenibacillus sp. GYB003 TaxID=2994392 RepID=UPI002F96B6BD